MRQVTARERVAFRVELSPAMSSPGGLCLLCYRHCRVGGVRLRSVINASARPTDVIKSQDVERCNDKNEIRTQNADRRFLS